MNGDRYLIKVTYLEGPHAGKVHFLRKGGYVTDLFQYQWDDTTYSSKGAAQRVCTRLTTNNDSEVEWERRMNEVNIQRGGRVKKENDFIYWPEKFEPIHVDQDTSEVDRKDLTCEELIACIQHDLKTFSCPRDRAQAELDALLGSEADRK